MYSLCKLYKNLARFVFYSLEDNRNIGHQIKEETITDIIISKLKTWNKFYSGSQFNIKDFTKKEESKNGSDFEWDWYFVDSSGRKWLGFRIQAKILNLKTNKFNSFNHNKGHQLNTLISSSNSDNRIPYYCFYLHKYDESPLRGCSLASYNNVIRLLRISKTPSVDDVIKESFPWHLLVCHCKYGCLSKYSLPERLLNNLVTLNEKDNFDLLSEKEVSKISYLLKNEQEYYDPNEYYSESSPDLITIIQDKEEFYD
ncbi:hypothetical protein NYR70_10735 [Actinobacillus equuli subsp. equuli]|uniref:DUF6615 family protein n=1 Tax=Actinobacillus equuli TaxID=718 RepID=UPI0024420EF2|nr:DUF6615 family protein [Actinobacillus equuli]WGE55081.1 hypothetical protein NYR70_10735 [Actinobacillus equuli subsp. equuli]